MISSPADRVALQQRLAEIRGRSDVAPDASVVIPVNAQADLANVVRLLLDVARYSGPYTIEIILVINNYPPEQPPAEIGMFESMGLTIVSIPNVRRQGEHVSLSARMHGVEVAASETTIHFDADCRVPNASALIDWYVEQFRIGAQAAYTPVYHYDARRDISIRARIAAHHFIRWFKRAVLGIPTIRGSNFAVNRSAMLHLYAQGYLAVDFNIGPAFKAKAGRVVYGGSKELAVLTSGRYLRSGWRELVRYLLYRLQYNIRMLPVRTSVKSSKYYTDQQNH